MKRLLSLFVVSVAAPALTSMYSTGGLLSGSEAMGESSQNLELKLSSLTPDSPTTKKKKKAKKKDRKGSTWISKLTPEEKGLMKSLVGQGWEDMSVLTEEGTKEILKKVKQVLEEQKKNLEEAEKRSKVESNVQEDDYR